MAIGIAYQLVVNLNVRHRLWGADSLWREANVPASDYTDDAKIIPDLGQYIFANGGLFDAVYFVVLMVAIAAIWVDNWMLRGVLFAGYVCIYSGNPIVLDGGVDAATHYLLASLFVVSSSRAKEGGLPPWRVQLHNAATVYITAQAAAIYVVAGLWKVADFEWRTGSALEGILLQPTFSFSGLAASLAGTFIGVFIAYLTVGTELLAWVAVVTRYPLLRRTLVGLLLLVHVGIILVMGLVSFGIVMMGVAVMLLRDSDIDATREFIAQRRDRVGGRMRRRAEKSALDAAS